MTLTQTCCLLLLLDVLAGSLLGSVYSAKQGCRGDNILLFQNTHIDQNSTILILYFNGNNYKQIGMWNIQQFVYKPTLLNGYQDRICLDLYGNIWIRDLHDPDEGNYTIKVHRGNDFMNYSVELNVFVAPNASCKPKIITGEDALTTHLDQVGCGKPAATAYWLEQRGILIDGKKIKWIPGQDAGTVYACIDSPALICVKNAKPTDYCTVYKDENVSTRTTTATLVLIILVFLAIIVGIPIALYILYRCLKDMLNKKATPQNSEDQHLMVVRPTNQSEDESNE